MAQVNYWDCPYIDYEYDFLEGEGEIHYYYCNHSCNEDKWCHLDNKWCGAKADCKLLDEGISTNDCD